MISRKKAKAKRRIRRAPEPRIVVVPSPDIEARVAREVERGVAVARQLAYTNAFESGYLVSAIYYHDGLFGQFHFDNKTVDPADRIVAQIANQMPPATKPAWVRMLQAEAAELYAEAGAPWFVVPVPYKPIGTSRNVHPFAIDLFVDEGTAVRSASRGVVVLAETGWAPNQWFSTSSVRGGNAVIVFDPARDLFYRYAHLQSVSVSAGDWVEPGDVVGAVGHTGFNANRPGHGQHLHFEINEFDPRTGLVNAIGHDDLESLLEAARTPLPAIREETPGSVESASPQTAPE